MVFSTGSIAFSQSLPYNNFDNDSSKVLANVVDPFSSKTKLSGWAWSAEDK
jgi:N,N-dimethylformamidase